MFFNLWGLNAPNKGTLMCLPGLLSSAMDNIALMFPELSWWVGALIAPPLRPPCVTSRPPPGAPPTRQGGAPGGGLRPLPTPTLAASVVSSQRSPSARGLIPFRKGKVWDLRSEYEGDHPGSGALRQPGQRARAPGHQAL